MAGEDRKCDVRGGIGIGIANLIAQNDQYSDN